MQEIKEILENKKDKKSSLKKIFIIGNRDMKSK